MEQIKTITDIIALTMGVAWAAGINLYAAIATLGILGITGNMALPPDLQVLADPLVVGAACLMFAVEFVADKMPGVDTGWDTIHTFIRIPAGALLAAGAVGDISPAVTLAAALLGGTLAAGSHGLKAGSRLLINTSPEPLTNWTASILEDIMVVGGIWAAVNHPWLFLTLLGVFVILTIWLLPKLWRGVKMLASRIKALFAPRPSSPPMVDADAAATTEIDRHHSNSTSRP